MKLRKRTTSIAIACLLVTAGAAKADQIFVEPLGGRCSNWTVFTVQRDYLAGQKNCTDQDDPPRLITRYLEGLNACMICDGADWTTVAVDAGLAKLYSFRWSAGGSWVYWAPFTDTATGITSGAANPSRLYGRKTGATFEGVWISHKKTGSCDQISKFPQYADIVPVADRDTYDWGRLSFTFSEANGGVYTKVNGSWGYCEVTPNNNIAH